MEIPSSFGSDSTIGLSQGVMTLNPPKPIVASVDATTKYAIELLQNHHIGCALVVDKDGKLEGIYSERDIVQKWALSDIAPEELALTEIMTPEKAGFYDKNASLTICTLNSTGELSRKKLIDCEKKCDIAIMPRGCWQISNHRLLITMQGKNERSFGILNLE